MSQPFLRVFLVILAGGVAKLEAQDNQAPQKQDAAQRQPAPPPRPVPAIQLPAVQLPAQRLPRGIILRGFRGRIGPDGMVAAGEGYAIFPHNREVMRRLEQAGELIAEERMADAFEVLDAILGEEQDYFYQPDRTEQVHRSIKNEARRLIGGLSAEALAQYDLQFGATARQMLDKAVAEGSADGVAAVARRYFNTQAGFEAAWLLGRQQLDHGQTLAAAMTFQMLFDSPRAKAMYDPALSLTLATCWLRAGVRERAAAVLAELRKEGDRPRIAAKEVALFAEDAQAVEWLAAHTGSAPEVAAAQLANWQYHRGNPSRNAAGSGGSPLLSMPRWQQTLDGEAKAEADDSLSKQLVESNEVDLPAETPLAVGEMAIVRSPRWVVGVNLRTGKRVWEYQTWESGKYSLRQQVMNPFTGGPMTIVPHKLATRTTLASDGRAVFVVEDRGNEPYYFPFGAVIRRGATPQGMLLSNKLIALELSTEGKLLWEVGGETGEGEPRLAGAYFLGAPLTMGGQLYVIGELKGEISLFVLDAASGRLDWSQPLATVETPLALDSFRRLHGAMPSFADGVMVCPTSAGAIVAVDVANRSLLWGYEYPRNQAIHLSLGRNSGEIGNPFGAGRWRDGAVIVASGRVLVTPADSDHLHCINLLDGKEAWKPVPRNESLFIGGIYRDTVLVVGRRDFQGLKLGDGQPAWPAQSLAEENQVVPSGRGFQSNGHYYLPLANAEVIKIDLADGTIKARVKSRKGYVLGNLVSYQGSVLSLNEDSLDCFWQLDEREQWATETLRIRPDDPDALAMFGEILVDTGKLAEGLVQLQRAFALAPNDHLRELLIETHLQMLRQDFARHRARASEIEALLTDPVQRSSFAREMALGLHAVGDRMSAFEYYVKMCQPGDPPKELEPIAPAHLARRDRFVRAKIGELREAATDEERRQMDERIEQHLLDLGGGTDLAVLRQFVRYFGSGELAGVQHSALVDRLIDEKAPLEAEWWLLRQTRSKDGDEAAEAWLSLAELMLRLDRPEDAASCYRSLEREFADQQLSDGRTGKELVAALAADAPARRFLSPHTLWPKEVVEAGEPTQPGLNYIAMQLDVSHGREPFFEHLTLELDTNRQELLLRDGYGREKFRVPLNDSRRLARSVNYNSVPWARAAGHILLVQERTQVLAVDALSSQRSGQARVLWRRDLADLATDGSDLVIRAQGSANRRLRSQWLDQRGRPIGGIWPVGSELVCMQRGDKLLAIDAFSGDVLWIRNDIAPAGEIFGDDELVFVVPANSSQAVVLRALDGAKLGTRQIAGERHLTFGRKYAEISRVDGKTRVRISDAWIDRSAAEATIWQEDFAADSKFDTIDSDEIAVLEPGGRFVVYSLDSERLVVDTSIKPPATLSEVRVVRRPDRYVVLVGQQMPIKPGMAQMYPVQSSRYHEQTVIHGGRAYGFERRTGKLLWGPSDELSPTAILRNQPVHVPIMVLAMNLNEQTVRLNSPRAKTSVLCLDTRDGRVVYSKELFNVSTNVVAVANPQQAKLEIRGGARTVTLAFGDKKPAGDAGAKPDGAKQNSEQADASKGEDLSAAEQPADGDPFGPPTPAPSGAR